MSPPHDTLSPSPLVSARHSPLSSPPLQPLSESEGRERTVLRDAMRKRQSVDHFARAWYGGIVSLIVTGVLLKLNHDTHRARWILIPVAAACCGLWIFVAVYALRTRRVARREQQMLQRLELLDARAPKAPELF